MSASKQKTQKQIAIQLDSSKIEKLLELERIVAVRYKVAFGIKVMNRKIMQKQAKELRGIRERRAKLKELMEKLMNGERVDVNTIKNLRKDIEQLKEVAKKKTEKERAIKSELWKNIRYMDNLIVGMLGITEKDAITDPNNIPPEYRVPEPKP